MSKLQNFSVSDLIHVNKGINTLLAMFLADNDNEFSNDVQFNIFELIQFQNIVLLDEIEKRLPLNSLEITEIRKEASNEEAK